MENINLSFVAAVILGIATLVLLLMYAYMRVTCNLTVSNLNHWISSCQKAHEEELRTCREIERLKTVVKSALTSYNNIYIEQLQFVSDDNGNFGISLTDKEGVTINLAGIPVEEKDENVECE